MRTLLTTILPVLPLLLVALAPRPAAAQWPTTEWTIAEKRLGVVEHKIGEFTYYKEIVGGEDPEGEREAFAYKHAGILEGASRWYESLGFPAPFQITPDYNLKVDEGESYLAILKSDTTENSSSHNTSGYMKLTTHPGFLTADSPVWTLMETSAVHELFHAIQKGASPQLRRYNASDPPNLTGCPDDDILDWLIEGTAAVAQIRWIEGKEGVPYGHPFKGSHRAAWVRYFDQPLHRGSIPPERRGSESTRMTMMETVSWYCDYGTWYFWYAVGEMLGRTEAEKVAYTRFLFDGNASWADGGLANVDAGLKAAAEAYDAITPYRGGLYDLYPQFVAQYLTEDRFYENLGVVELETPDYYETTSSVTGGALRPLASRAWRVRVHLPQNASPIPYAVRFTLDTPAGTNRDDLHLIVGTDLAARPGGPTALHRIVERIDPATPRADGAVEYLVRVANVARDVTRMAPADFSLRIEVEGFYGEEVAEGPTAGGVAGDLPPGFAVRGPGRWTCSGGADARARFHLITPDELIRDVKRAPGVAREDAEDWADEVEIKLKRGVQQGRPAAERALERIQAMRKKAEEMRAAQAPGLDAAAAKLDAELRAETTSSLVAHFVGTNGGSECVMTFGARLGGREGGAQILPMAVDEYLHPDVELPKFEVGIGSLDLIRAARADLRSLDMGDYSPDAIRAGRLPPEIGADVVGEDREVWEVCAMTARERQEELRRAPECPAVVCTAGRLTLEHAARDHIAGSFQFEVLRWAEGDSHAGCSVPEGRGVVVGHFNVTSTGDRSLLLSP